MTVRVLAGDCRDVLPTLAAGSVHCVVTSPPYYGLRDYGTAQWDGGDAGCDHQGDPWRTASSINKNWDGGNDVKNAERREFFRDICGKCGARRIDRQLGLEATPDEYIQTMVAVFREVRRVLRDDGTCWVNMGDSYASGEVGRHDHKQAAGICDGDALAGRANIGNGMGAREQRALSTGLPSKNLLMVPARLALALQSDGWWIRSDIIWAKPNPMPESVTDRPTSAHEHVFLLSKSARYYYDADAVREEATKTGTLAHLAGGSGARAGTREGLRREEWIARKRLHPESDDVVAPLQTGVSGDPSSRNLRNVWTIATHAFSDFHYATFPPTLVERCIKAGCPRDGVVLDPFAGAGTTMLVADRLQRHAIGIELNEAYAMMARNRIVADAPLFAEVAD